MGDDSTLSATALFSATNLKPPEDESMVVLMVDDDQRSGETVGQMLAREKNLEFHFCNDASKALVLATAIKPTVILQDLDMPGTDGLELIAEFRANEQTRDTPLIAMSSAEDPMAKVKSFSRGASDFLVKVPDQLELIARVRYHSTAYVAIKQRNLALQALRKELSDAADYVRSLLPQERSERPTTTWRYIPSTQLGGDGFGYHWIDRDHMAIYLLDVCGHGVGPALLSVSVLNVLNSHSLRDADFRDPAQVLTGLNARFPMEQQSNQFFTIWYGVFNKTARTLSYASGGHPPAILLTGTSAADAALNCLTTSGFAVGVMPQASYNSASCTLDEHATLFVFSDGAYEIKKSSDGEMLSFQEWADYIAAYGRSQRNDLDIVLAEMRSLQGARQFEDDVSLLQIDF